DDKVMSTSILGVLEEAPDKGTCFIGSIKANIGHCKAAASAAGIVKAVMALKRKVIPPTMNCRQPNAVLERPFTALRPAMYGQPWQTDGKVRRASVSAMGFGGANSHLALEEANPQDDIEAGDLALLATSQDTELVLLAGEDEADLLGKVESLLPLADRICRAELTDLA